MSTNGKQPKKQFIMLYTKRISGAFKPNIPRSFFSNHNQTKMNILVYDDEGVSSTCLHQTLISLSSNLSPNYSVQKINSTQVIQEPWEDTAALFVIPGGRDLPYLQKLSGQGNSKIRNYVENGGKYLGICAGGYYACDSLEFQLGTPLEVKGKRELNFLNGIAKGTVYPNFVYNSEEGSKAAFLQVKETNENVCVYYNGGCYFHFPENKDIEVIAKYSDIQKPAIVKCFVKKGLAILTGVHVEFNPSILDSKNPFSAAILPDLLIGNTLRQELFRNILKSMYLQVSETPQIKPNLSEIYLISDSITLKQISSTLSEMKNDLIFENSQQPTIQFFNDKEKMETPSDSKIPIILTDNQNIVPFNYPQFQKFLETKTFGRTLMIANVVTSTQLLMSEYFNLFRNMPNGILFTALQQVGGVGRGSNVWVSPEGCLMFSLQVKFLGGKDIVFIQYLTAVAIVDSIRSLPGYKDLPIEIKWPNDIYSGSKKLGGILITSNYLSEFVVVIGVGLNLWNDRPSACINSVIKEFNNKNNCKLDYISREKMLALFLSRFESYFQEFLQHGFQPFLSQYLKYWKHSNQNVQLVLEDGRTVNAIIKGISSEGFLLARDHNENLHELHPDGNSFDIMKGLISRKKGSPL